MVCKECGAKFDENELLCPYCGAENFQVAKEQQDQYVKDYKRKKKELKRMPEKIVKKTTKTMFYLAGGLFVGVILLLIVVTAFSKIVSSDMLARQEKEIAKLEGYYSKGDYEAMCDYLEEIDKRGGSYEKYNRIYDLYENMDWKIEAVKENLEYAKTIEPDASYVAADLERCLAELAKIAEMESLHFPYGEKEGALFVKAQYMSALTDYALLTETEIESAVSVYKQEGNDYLELAEIAIQRMEEYVQ